MNTQDDDFLSRVRARAGQPRKTGGAKVVIGATLSAFLLGMVLMGYVAVKTGADFGFSGKDEPAAATSAAPQQLAAEPTPSSSPSATPTKTDTAAVKEAAKAVEKVAEQQGGLEARVVAMEQRLTAIDLQTQAASGNAARAEALLIAFSARRSIERGKELGDLADQLKLRFGDAHPNAVRTVIEAAKNPVTLDKLIARLDGLTPQLADPAPQQVSWSWFKRELAGLFVIRRDSSPSPAPQKRIERARLFLESGRVGPAVEEISNLPGADQEVVQAWLADAKRYADAQDALEQLEAAALFDNNQLRDSEGKQVKQPSPVAKKKATS